MLKVGVVGCGGVGLRHSLAYQSHPESELVCVCDMVAGREPAPTGMDGLKALQVIEAAIKSFEEKKVVAII